MTTVMFGVDMHLLSGGDDPAAHFEHVVGCYGKLEAADDRLLDVAFGYSAQGELGRIDAELTVSARTAAEAIDIARGAVRTAIHHAGGSTPDWDASGDDGVVVYRLVDDQAQLVS